MKGIITKEELIELVKVAKTAAQFQLALDLYAPPEEAVCSERAVRTTEHYIIARIDYDREGRPVIGNQASIEGKTEFETLADAESAIVNSDIPFGYVPVRMPPAAQFFIALEVPKVPK